MATEQSKSFARSPAELVDGLIGISDRKHIAFIAGEKFQNFHLCEVGVLKFVDKNEPSVPALEGKQVRVLLEKFVGLRHHVSEGAEVLLGQHVLYRGKHARDFATALQYLCLADAGAVLGTRNTGNGKFSALEALNVVSVFLRSDQLVMAAAHEVEQVFQELSHIGRAHKISQAQLADALTQENPQVLVVQDAKVLAGTNEQIVAVGVDSAGLQT